MSGRHFKSKFSFWNFFPLSTDNLTKAETTLFVFSTFYFRFYDDFGKKYSAQLKSLFFFPSRIKWKEKCWRRSKKQQKQKQLKKWKTDFVIFARAAETNVFSLFYANLLQSNDVESFAYFRELNFDYISDF